MRMDQASFALYSSQGRRNIAALHREYALRQRWEPEGPSVTFVHLVYKAPDYPLHSPFRSELLASTSVSA
jgi:hypothetical protein